MKELATAILYWELGALLGLIIIGIILGLFIEYGDY